MKYIVRDGRAGDGDPKGPLICRVLPLFAFSGLRGCVCLGFVCWDAFGLDGRETTPWACSRNIGWFPWFPEVAGSHGVGNAVVARDSSRGQTGASFRITPACRRHWRRVFVGGNQKRTKGRRWGSGSRAGATQADEVCPKDLNRQRRRSAAGTSNRKSLRRKSPNTPNPTRPRRVETSTGNNRPLSLGVEPSQEDSAEILPAGSFETSGPTLAVKITAACLLPKMIF